ncbi:MAG: HAD family phosphatase [Acidimicrobiia bacterium]|nr:MAG: HAD family phosphatase [Acidimicrobiia bacterium]
MFDIKVLFFDIGGVLLTNGWDRTSRRLASDEFGLDWDEFQDRHDSVSEDFETGKLTTSEYLRRTVFFRDRGFTEAAFVDFMESQSKAKPDSLAVAGELAATGQYLMATLNNESRELNDFRIKTFGLQKYFSVFLSSSYLGVSKPNREIYSLAVDVVQYQPEQCVFIDDRELNLECANLLGIRPVLFTDADQLRVSLGELGVTV